MDTPPRTLAASQTERRRSPRYSFDLAFEIEWGSAVIQGRVSDISADGLRVALADPLWVGASFVGRLMLDTPLRVECVVRRVEPGHGMGVTFSLPGGEDYDRYSALLENLVKK